MVIVMEELPPQHMIQIGIPSEIQVEPQELRARVETVGERRWRTAFGVY